MVKCVHGDQAFKISNVFPSRKSSHMLKSKNVYENMTTYNIYIEMRNACLPLTVSIFNISTGKNIKRFLFNAIATLTLQYNFFPFIVTIWFGFSFDFFLFWSNVYTFNRIFGNLTWNQRKRAFILRNWIKKSLFSFIYFMSFKRKFLVLLFTIIGIFFLCFVPEMTQLSLFSR